MASEGPTTSTLLEPATEPADRAKPARPFTDNVEFLEAKSREVMLLLRRAETKQGSRGEESRAEGRSTVAAGSASVATEGEKGHGRPTIDGRDLDAIERQLTGLRAGTLARLQASSPEDIPFLSLVQHFDLDDLAQEVVWLLFFNATSADFRRAFHDSRLATLSPRMTGEMYVSDILGLLFPGDFRRQLQARAVFSRDKPLLGRYLASAAYDLSNGQSILELELALCPRVVQWITGDTNEYDVESSFVVERPKTNLDHVIVPDDVIAPILRLVERHDDCVRLRRSLGIDDVVEYGRSVVILEYGPSGTGKTMLARALSSRTGRPLVSIRGGAVKEASPHHWPGRTPNVSLDALFREAQLQNGIVFVDECHEVCGTNAPYLRDFLLELEKSDALVIMATNKPFELPPAIDRRITLKVPFEVPSAPLRERIWRLHLPPAVPLAADVDIGHLAAGYPLAGGYIKNAVLMALNFALSRCLDGSVQLTQADLEAAAGLQERRVGGGSVLGELKSPAATLNHCLVPEDMRARLRSLSRALRGYAALYDRWGLRRRMDGAHPRGIKILFHGESYRTALAAAEAVAGEVPLRVRCVALHRVSAAVEERKRAHCQEATTVVFAGAAPSLWLGGGQALVVTDDRGLLGQAQDRSERGPVDEVLEYLAAIDGVVFIVSAARGVRGGASLPWFHERLRFDLPDASQRAVYWRSVLAGVFPTARAADVEALAARYGLDYEGIGRAVQRACLVTAAAGPDGALDMPTLHEAAEYASRFAGADCVLFGEPRHCGMPHE